MMTGRNFLSEDLSRIFDAEDTEFSSNSTLINDIRGSVTIQPSRWIPSIDDQESKDTSTDDHDQKTTHNGENHSGIWLEDFVAPGRQIE